MKNSKENSRDQQSERTSEHHMTSWVGCEKFSLETCPMYNELKIRYKDKYMLYFKFILKFDLLTNTCRI